jgi:carbon monoxide dehydrogenase subunit G
LVAVPVVVYSGTHDFGITPEELWAAIEHVEKFGGWWGWLQEFRLEGDGLAQGSVLHGVVAPPLPYRMKVRVDILQCVRNVSIDAEVHGDLEGVARIELKRSPTGTSVTIGWTVEMMQRPMRLASRFARPLLQWGHDRVVEMTLRNLPAEFGYPLSLTIHRREC